MTGRILDYGHMYEGRMARTELDNIERNAKKLHKLLRNDDDLPEWVNKKIVLANSYLQSATNYLHNKIAHTSHSTKKRKTRKTRKGKQNKRFIKTRSKRQKGGTNDDINIKLIWASYQGKTEDVVTLLKAGADVNAKNPLGWTALMEASKEGNEETAKELLKNGAEVDMKDDEGWTALIWASRIGRTEIVAMLLERGADVNAKNNYGYTALMLASEKGYSEIVSLLLANGAVVNAKTNNRYTALMLASEKGHTEIMELLEKAIETDEKIRGHKQAAMELVRHRDVKIPSLRTLAYRQLPTSTTTEINEVNDLLIPPSKLGGKRRTKRSKKKTRKTHKK